MAAAALLDLGSQDLLSGLLGGSEASPTSTHPPSPTPCSDHAMLRSEHARTLANMHRTKATQRLG